MISPECLADSLVALFKASDPVSWVGVERDLEISVVQVCHELDVVGEKLLVPPRHVSWSQGSKCPGMTYVYPVQGVP